MFWNTGNFQGLNRLPAVWGDVFCVETQYVLTWSDKNVTHKLDWPVFQLLQVKHIEESSRNKAWRKWWGLCLKEAAPWREMFSVYFKEASYHHRKCSRKISSNWRKRMQKKNFFTRAPNRCKWHRISYKLTLGLFLRHFLFFIFLSPWGYPGANFNAIGLPFA